MSTDTQKTPTAQHTPTPWQIYVPLNNRKQELPQRIMGGDLMAGPIAIMGITTSGKREANAAFIVRACNEYDADKAKIAVLMSALENAENDLRAMQGNPHWEQLAEISQANIRAALKET